MVSKGRGGVENVSVQSPGGFKHLETESAKFAQKLPYLHTHASTQIISCYIQSFVDTNDQLWLFFGGTI